MENRKEIGHWGVPGSGEEHIDEELLQASYAHLEKSLDNTTAPCIEYEVSGVCKKRAVSTTTVTRRRSLRGRLSSTT